MSPFLLLSFPPRVRRSTVNGQRVRALTGSAGAHESLHPVSSSIWTVLAWRPCGLCAPDHSMHPARTRVRTHWLYFGSPHGNSFRCRCLPCNPIPSAQPVFHPAQSVAMLPDGPAYDRRADAYRTLAHHTRSACCIRSAHHMHSPRTTLLCALCECAPVTVKS